MISVIITTKDRKNVLSETMEVLLSENTDKSQVKEIIIVNDGSDDLTEYLQFEKIQVVKNSGKGLAAGRNTGARLATADLLLFFDDDILIKRDHFNKHQELHDQFPNVLATANRFYPEKLIEEAKKTSFGRYKLEHEYNWLDGCELTEIPETPYSYSTTLAGFSCSIPREIWEELGGFNETFPYAGCEDNEFFVRAKKAGVKLIFDESNICYHNELDNFTLRKWISRQARGIKGAVLLCELHPEGKTHPTYYLHEPIRPTDSADLKKKKRKKIFLANGFVLWLCYGATVISEFLHLPESVIYRTYNAVWIGESKRSFMEAFTERGHK